LAGRFRGVGGRWAAGSRHGVDRPRCRSRPLAPGRWACRGEQRAGLCVLHHKTFDLGAFTVTPGGVLLVSDQANGTAGFHEALMRHHGTKVRPAQRPEWSPAPEHLEWHRSEVFKGEARHYQAG